MLYRKNILLLLGLKRLYHAYRTPQYIANTTNIKISISFPGKEFGIIMEKLELLMKYVSVLKPKRRWI